MDRIRIALGAAILALAASAPEARTDVPVVVAPAAGPVERTAAEELASFLSTMFPRFRFAVSEALPPSGPAVLVGTRDGGGPAAAYIDREALRRPGSCAVKGVKEGGRTLGVVAGADPRAALHGAYALLESLGCAFTLSDSRVPVRAEAAFDPSSWDLRDAPVVADRVVFNWHNFLSGCSGWDFPEWQAWIRAAARMRFSAVMVHAYGNNPMACFSHNGKTKPVGWLTTTARGRDWGAQHVNDVRRLAGGDLFDAPVFGCAAALVPDGERVAAAKALMKKVFAEARRHGLDVFFALDVDTEPANPAEIVGTLPASARFKSGRLPNPDAPEGYAYFKAQVESLLSDYPEINRLVVWFRTGGTPWRQVAEKDLPEAWRADFEAIAERNPKARNAGLYAISRIVRAFRKILDEGGRGGVKLDTGTWQFGHMPALDAYAPRGVGFIGLDYGIKFDQPEVQDVLKAVSPRRPVLPVVWAHHDDHTYIGRPYAPFANFARQLEGAGASGFGIIHWTTRPLDLYFRSLAEQTWEGTRDVPFRETCGRMAGRFFGPAQGARLGEYLHRWATEGPMFGRETTDRFVDKALPVEETVDRARKRLEALDAVDAAGLDAPARERLEYFRLLERFFIVFHESQGALDGSIRRLKAGDLEGAREAIRAARPEEAIRAYRDAARRGGPTRGEQAIVVSLNLRWRPYFAAQRQALGLEPVRVRFQPTQHDPLAQGAGTRTFFADGDGALWLGLGERETRGEAFILPADAGVRFGKPYTYASPVLPAGRYRVRLLAAGPGGVFDVSVAGGPPDRVDAARGALDRVYPVELGSPGAVQVSVTPVEGEAVLSGLVIEPAGPGR